MKQIIRFTVSMLGIVLAFVPAQVLFHVHLHYNNMDRVMATYLGVAVTVIGGFVIWMTWIGLVVLWDWAGRK